MALLGIGALPGVQAVAATTALPPFDAGVEVAVDLVGVSTARDSRAGVQLVTSDYFRTLGISVGTGTHVSRLDTRRAATVCSRQRGIRTTVRCGSRSRTGWPSTGVGTSLGRLGSEPTWRVRDCRCRRRCAEPGAPAAGPTACVPPWSGIGRGYPLLLVSSRIEPANAIGMIRRELALIDRQVAAAQPRTLASLLVSFVALTACYIPARRAMRVEPSAALREE